MLHGTSQLSGDRVHARDGEIGRVADVYFDDERWVVRYLIVDTGGWLSGRKVLISPHAVQRIEAGAVGVDLTRGQIERSPHIDTARPVSRQHEAEYYRYYGYPEYWPYTTYWAWGAMPVVVPPDPELVAAKREAAGEDQAAFDSHLRSSKEVTGYHIEATDEALGHVEDFLFDEETWAIRYLAVDTRKWLPGKHVLVPIEWVRGVSWAERTVKIEAEREQIEQSPEYNLDHLPSPRSLHETGAGRPAR